MIQRFVLLDALTGYKSYTKKSRAIHQLEQPTNVRSHIQHVGHLEYGLFKLMDCPTLLWRQLLDSTISVENKTLGHRKYR